MSAVQDLPRRRFTADEVDRMVQAGVLSEDDPLELIDGELVVVSPQGPPHASVKNAVLRALGQAYAGSDAHVRSQDPLDLDEVSRPEPDVAIVRGSPLDYATRHPTGADTLLVVEVAWTSHDVDRAKASVYARAGVPVYWLLDLRARRLEVHEQPRADGTWSRVTLLGEDQALELPGAEHLRVADLLP